MLKKNNHSLYCWIICWLALLFASRLVAQQQDTLRLADVFRLVLNTHPQLQAAFLEEKITLAEIENAKAGFDPIFRSSMIFREDAGETRLNTLGAGAEITLPTLFAPKLNLSYRKTTGFAVNPESQTPDGGYGVLGVSIPLWQNIVTDRNRTSLEKAKLRPLLTKAIITAETNNLLRVAGTLYWNWIEAVKLLEVSEQVLSIAEQRYSFLVKRAKAGEIPALDTIEVLQEVERRRGEVFRSKRGVELTTIDLSAMIWLSTQKDPEPLPAWNYKPVNNFTLDRISAAQGEADKKNASNTRPELLRLLYAEQLTNFDLTLAQEGKKPALDAEGIMYYKGDTPKLDNFRLGLSFSMPLFVRAATAQSELFSITLERVRLQRLFALRTIDAEITNALSQLQRALERVEAAEREVLYARQMEEGERKRFTSGESSLLFVNLRERAAAESKARLINAQGDYSRALLYYYWSVNNIQTLSAPK